MKALREFILAEGAAHLPTLPERQHIPLAAVTNA